MHLIGKMKVCWKYVKIIIHKSLKTYRKTFYQFIKYGDTCGIYQEKKKHLGIVKAYIKKLINVSVNYITTLRKKAILMI